MPISRRVVVYGNTLALAGIALALQNRPDFQVVTIEIESADAAQQLDAACPDVIIFDLAQPDAREKPIFLLSGKTRFYRSDLLLLGVDANSNHILVWSGQMPQATTVQDLVQVIERQSPVSSQQ